MAAVFAAVLVGLSAAPAAAVDAPWYLSTLKLDAGAAEGFTGEGVTIAVIDGQINPDVPALADADLQIHEPSFCYEEDGSKAPAASTELSPTKTTDHGTNVVSMIVGSGAGYDGQPGITGVAPGATILYYSVYTANSDAGLRCLNDSGNDHSAFDAAMTQAVDDGADIISVSLAMGAGDEYSLAATRALRDGVIIVGSVSNTSELQLSGQMPAYGNGVVGVQAAGADSQIQSTNGVPNSDALTDIVAPGLGISVQGDRATGLWSATGEADGTSLAVPIVVGSLALAMDKYPTATGNQMVQSLIRNTSGDPDKEPEYDGSLLTGYGYLSVANLMAVDPTSYDDVNPLIAKEDSRYQAAIPTYDEIFNAAIATEEQTPSSGTDTSGAGVPVWIWIVVGGFLVLAAVIGVVIVVVVRRTASTTAQ